jgi:hypothetical protein
VEPVVIRARVRARLLGLPLLTLTARIIAESQENHVLVVPAAGPVVPAAGPVSAAPAELGQPAGSAEPAQLTRTAGGRPAAARGPGRQAVAQRGTGVARARQLVSENARQLARRRGIPD